VPTRTQAKVNHLAKSDGLLNPPSILHRSPKPDSEFDPAPADPEQVDSGLLSGAKFQANFSQVPVGSRRSPLVQPKLIIGQPNDQYEQEADRVANQVMGMSEPAGGPLPSSAPSIQPYRSQFNQPLQRQPAESEINVTDLSGIMRLA
jgi:hypothetical protein